MSDRSKPTVPLSEQIAAVQDVLRVWRTIRAPRDRMAPMEAVLQTLRKLERPDA